MTQISTTELKARLVSFAREVGFDSCRVAACNAPAHANDFREWLRDGAHGEMNYMQRGEEKRCDPEQVLSGARSIVVLAVKLFPGRPGPPNRDYSKNRPDRAIRLGRRLSRRNRLLATRRGKTLAIQQSILPGARSSCCLVH
jgi:epoxyqueuosine reductase QueG